MWEVYHNVLVVQPIAWLLYQLSYPCSYETYCRDLQIGFEGILKRNCFEISMVNYVVSGTNSVPIQNTYPVQQLYNVLT